MANRFDTVVTDGDARYQAEGPVVSQSIAQGSAGLPVLQTTVLGPEGILNRYQSSLDAQRYKELAPADLARGKVVTMPVRQPESKVPVKTLVGIGIAILFVVFVLPRL